MVELLDHLYAHAGGKIEQFKLLANVYADLAKKAAETLEGVGITGTSITGG
jgi:hypothetical protein